MTTTKTLTARRGDDIEYQLTIKNADGSAVLNLTQCAIWFTVKDADDRSSSDANALVALSWQDSPRIEHGITVADVTTGIAKVVIPHATMALLNETSSYVWDMQVRDSTPWVETPFEGPFVVSNDVTTSTTVS